MRLRWLVLFAGASGCGVLSGLDGLEVGDASVDASSEASPIDASLDVGPSCGAGACGAPAGFQPVLFATSAAATSCPSGATQLDVVVDPLAPPNACTCTCEDSPTCLPEALVYGTGNNCGTQTKTNITLDGGCNNAGGSIPPSHVSITPFPPTNACTNKLVTGSLQDTHGRICGVSDCSACTAPVGFELCFAQNGDVQCPAGMKQHAVGASDSMQCGPCSACSSTATCKGNLEIFDDGACLSSDGQLPVDGTCQLVSSDFFGAFKYVPTVDPGTCTGGTSTATVSLTSRTTVCCP